MGLGGQRHGITRSQRQRVVATVALGHRRLRGSDGHDCLSGSQSISASTAALTAARCDTNAGADRSAAALHASTRAATGTTRRAGAPAWRGADMSQPQRDAAPQLLRSALHRERTRQGARGDGAGDRAARARDLRPRSATRATTRSRSTANRRRRPPWGWRIEGHHLSLHWTLAGRPLRGDAAAVLRRQPGSRAARLRQRPCAPARACSARKKTARARCSLRCRRRSAQHAILRQRGPTATSSRATPRASRSRPNPTASISDH